MKRLLPAFAFVAALSLTFSAAAQTYPTRPITMIVPYPPGGPTDTIGRIFAERMRASLGQPVILENIGGAAGTLGTARAARAAPDGYTINFSNVESHVCSCVVLKQNFELLQYLRAFGW